MIDIEKEADRKKIVFDPVDPVILSKFSLFLLPG
jgi:hypothetical protein